MAVFGCVVNIPEVVVVDVTTTFVKSSALCLNLSASSLQQNVKVTGEPGGTKQLVAGPGSIPGGRARARLGWLSVRLCNAQRLTAQQGCSRSNR